MDMKILVVGDIHGRHSLVTQAFDLFLKEKYNKIIFLGDTADSHDLTDQDITRCYNIQLSMKKAMPDDVILLMGNHDEPYFHHNPKEYICQGFRPSIHRALSHVLIPQRSLYNYAWGVSNFLFTHAGISRPWYLKHFDVLSNWAEKMDVDVTDVCDMHILLDNLALTSDKWILHEIGAARGGYATDYGGPLWCDKSEIIDFGPLPGLNQVVGHTKQHWISRVHTFEDDKRYKDTSVTFCDVLGYREQFLTLNIKV